MNKWAIVLLILIAFGCKKEPVRIPPSCDGIKLSFQDVEKEIYDLLKPYGGNGIITDINDYRELTRNPNDSIDFDFSNHSIAYFHYGVNCRLPYVENRVLCLDTLSKEIVLKANSSGDDCNRGTSFGFDDYLVIDKLPYDVKVKTRIL